MSKKRIELGESLFIAQELRYNHYSYADLESRRMDYDIKHKYILFRYNFRETGLKEYIHIYTSNDLKRMSQLVKGCGIWEDHINKIKYFKGKFGLIKNN